MVSILLWTGIAGNVMAWGNKDFLIRSFSVFPANIPAAWQKSFGSRSVILVMVVVVVLAFLPVAFAMKCWISIFLLARFIYMSYDSIIVFNRKFLLIIILETIGFALICTGVLLFHPESLLQLFPWFVAAELLKATGTALFFQKELLPVPFRKFDFSYFLQAFSFFILYFSGMLASRIDLLCITLFFTKDDIARYQVLINFLQMMQIIIPILLLPYIATLYRLNIAAVRKISTRLFIAGIFISAIAVTVIAVAAGIIYRFHYAAPAFLFGWLMVLPGFYYSPIIYRLFKSNHQHFVVFISILFVLFCTAFIFLFRNLFADQITGVLAAVTLAQWLQGTIYFFAGRKIT